MALLATNYAFNANGVLVKGQPIYGVAFEGTVHPASEFGITADLGGTVSGISVKVGDTVQKGQALLRMDGREAELALQQAVWSCRWRSRTWTSFAHNWRKQTLVWWFHSGKSSRYPRGNGAILRKGLRPLTILR